MSSVSQAAAPKLGNPGVVGLAGFGLTTLLLQFHNLGWAGLGPVIWTGLIFGGLAQMIAGLQEQKCGNNFGYTAFTSFGAFWIALVGIFLGNKFEIFTLSHTDVGFFLLAWALYTAILWVASARVHMAMFLTFTTLEIGFVLLVLEKFGFGESLGWWAGVDLSLCALLAWYMMAHIIFLDLFGRDILPVGKPLVH
ncbi:acetate uptake transporter [Pararhodospirillum photometricum]|uniref:GPR1/FUN34/yaaH family protein n=1 Tax=Pararhodospirillum photometricum DSM 122 TaxID=1150469 RepID=H6SR17_PARPM|nr:GPR1/FUN34/YaaH family transporter [Pararhodospirillum photometricum]CCG09739.1 GPR1/FUN34/yaaH family protein [Pararhodospirillum photometricum DSM 122]